jgi:hypothetical protein
VRVPLAPVGAKESGAQWFQGAQRVARSGTFAYGLRIRGKGIAEELLLWA